MSRRASSTTSGLPATWVCPRSGSTDSAKTEANRGRLGSSPISARCRRCSTSSSPPEGLVARPLAHTDAAPAAQLLAEFDGAYLDEVTDRMNERDVLDWWRGRELESESIGISAGETGLAAFGLLAPREQGAVELQAFVHPDARGRGLGSFLLDWAEDVSRRRASRNLRTVIFPGDETALPLVAARGFRLVRHSYRMVVDLAEPPAEPHWPEGFS